MPETARNRDRVARGKKYQQQTTIGDLRKLYGADLPGAAPTVKRSRMWSKSGRH
jgi:hypothetical protein